ncbi:hypothetical protein Salat_0683900 [Sesamum alatum]|uniref:Uncharacterized protein n=1 Tax=Sesamum alatum TaxID=300844 RepID=A0AAE1YS62_9LAMI|nr:hypothetical protein Salat_0683900 [Sesamum alatum]
MFFMSGWPRRSSGHALRLQLEIRSFLKQLKNNNQSGRMHLSQCHSNAQGAAANGGSRGEKARNGVRVRRCEGGHQTVVGGGEEYTKAVQHWGSSGYATLGHQWQRRHRTRVLESEESSSLSVSFIHLKGGKEYKFKRK